MSDDQGQNQNLEQLQGKVDELTKALSTLTSKFEDERAGRQDLVAKKHRWSEKEKELQAKIEELESKLSDSAKDSNKGKDIKPSSSSEVEALRKELDALQKRLSQQENTNTELRKSIEREKVNSAVVKEFERDNTWASVTNLLKLLQADGYTFELGSDGKPYALSNDDAITLDRLRERAQENYPFLVKSASGNKPDSPVISVPGVQGKKSDADLTFDEIMANVQIFRRIRDNNISLLESKWKERFGNVPFPKQSLMNR